jgi:hypothetical protein
LGLHELGAKGGDDTRQCPGQGKMLICIPGEMQFMGRLGYLHKSDITLLLAVHYKQKTSTQSQSILGRL